MVNLLSSNFVQKISLLKINQFLDKSPTPSTAVTQPQSQQQIPLSQQPLTIRCRHSEVQTETLDSKQLQNQIIIFTDAKIEDEYIVKLEEKLLSNVAEKESPSVGKTTATPSASTRSNKQRKSTAAQEKESKTKGQLFQKFKALISVL